MAPILAAPTVIGIIPQEDGRVRYVRMDAHAPRERTHRLYQGRAVQAIIIGFECPRHRFYVHSENGDGILPMMAQFPSISASEDRIDLRFTDENEFFYFRMLWE